MQRLFLRHPANPAIPALVLFSCIAASLLAVDAFSPAVLPMGFVSNRQLVGIDLLLMLLPSYLLLAWGILHRRSWRLLGEVDQLLPGYHYRDRNHAPLRNLLIGALTGALYAVLFNLPISSPMELIQGGPLLICLVFWMIIIWVSVGVTLAARLYSSGLFLEAGKSVPIDPYDQSTLEPFARSGMGEMLLAVGALVLSTVQSIDATLRIQNYAWALLIGLPAMLLLLFRPMISIHQRLKARKNFELEAVNELIRGASKSLDPADMLALEPLLQRRDRIRGIATWPINISMVSRLIVYGVIPPIAWVAAALVERLIEGLLGG